MQPEDTVCYCMHVSLRKLTHFARREQPACASEMANCLGAGTGCGWCVPILERIVEDARAGRDTEIHQTPEQYAAARKAYRATGLRAPSASAPPASGDFEQPGPGHGPPAAPFEGA